MRWPLTLPQNLLIQGYVEKPPETTLRTQMDAGPSKSRRRFTAQVRPIQGSIVVTEAELRIFDDFFVTDTAGGSLQFDWVHPRYEGEQGAPTIQMRFTSTPQYTPLDPGFYQVQMQLEILP